MCDGGEPNRTFVKMLFGDDDPVERKFVAYNVHTGGELAVMIDCKVIHSINCISFHHNPRATIAVLNY